MMPWRAGAMLRYEHLTALVCAWIVASGGAAVLWLTASTLEGRAAAGELALPQAETARGLAMQEAVLSRADAHLLFGSSEIVRRSRFRAMEFFRSAPLGFRVVGIGQRGTPLIVTAFDLAALGSSLRDRKVAIFLSHSFFHADRDTGANESDAYLGTFSVRHASEIAFGRGLPEDVRRRVAARLLDRPEALEGEPLITAALRLRSDSGWIASLQHAALAPAGLAQRLGLIAQDHLRMARRLAAAPRIVSRSPPRPIDWPALSDSAERIYRPVASNNPFGMLDSWWSSFGSHLREQRGARNDREWSRDVAEARAWGDLELLMDILNAAGARALLLNLPHKGAYRNFEGTTPAGRRGYYDSLRAKAARAEIELRDFEAFEGDLWFMRDQSAHPSPKGWVHYNHALVEFFQHAAP